MAEDGPARVNEASKESVNRTARASKMQAMRQKQRGGRRESRPMKAVVCIVEGPQDLPGLIFSLCFCSSR
jgi:hypothetical protein